MSIQFMLSLCSLRFQLSLCVLSSVSLIVHIVYSIYLPLCFISATSLIFCSFHSLLFGQIINLAIIIPTFNSLYLLNGLNRRFHSQSIAFLILAVVGLGVIGPSLYFFFNVKFLLLKNWIRHSAKEWCGNTQVALTFVNLFLLPSHVLKDVGNHCCFNINVSFQQWTWISINSLPQMFNMFLFTPIWILQPHFRFWMGLNSWSLFCFCL